MNKTAHKISALLITYNEIIHIKKVIANLNFADEIIVVDSNSTDGTLEELQKNSNVTVISREFKNFTDQRNFALKQANHEWILFLDADERIPESLKNEILEVVKKNTDIAGFMVRRQHFYKNKPIRFSGYQTDKTYRLFRKDKVIYDHHRTVHELPIINGKSATLKNRMLHYSFSTYDNLKIKMERYGKLKALELLNKGKKANRLNYYLKITYKFLYNYIIRLGILDGKEGFVICYLNAYSVYCRYKELKRLSLISTE